MTFGFALITIGSVLMLSGYENVPIATVLATLHEKPKAGGTAFSAYLQGAGSGVSEAILGTGADGKGKTSVPGLSVGGASPSKAAAIAKGVTAATSIASRFEYAWGGGHNPQFAPSAAGEKGNKGYDCSGAVSFVLHAMGLISAPMVSGELASWGVAGPGKWITIYANANHTFMKIGGVWFGTGSDKEAIRGGPAWGNHDPDLSAYSVRHPAGF